MDRDVAEEKWGLGVVNAKRLQPNEFQFEEVATYIAAQAKRRIGHSKNLKKPIITIDSTSLTRRKVERLAIEEYSHKEFFEKKNKNYKFLKSDISLMILEEFIYMQKCQEGRMERNDGSKNKKNNIK